jgi:hypothetical protein
MANQILTDETLQSLAALAEAAGNLPMVVATVGFGTLLVFGLREALSIR